MCRGAKRQEGSEGDKEFSHDRLPGKEVKKVRSLWRGLVAINERGKNASYHDGKEPSRNRPQAHARTTNKLRPPTGNPPLML
jgi:hypothetical protein